MKAYLENRLLLPALMAGLGLVLAGRVTAQTFTTLYSFPTLSNFSNSDGASPAAGLILSGNTLYGAADAGGIWGKGTVYKVNINGTDFTTLHNFTATSPSSSSTNSDGASPTAELVLSGNALFGTARAGGSSGKGTVFTLNTDGTGFTTLHSFTAFTNFGINNDGAYPVAGLILSGNTLYGTAAQGGGLGTTGGNFRDNGTVFAVNTDGSGFTVLHSFTPGIGSSRTNNDGAYPAAGLVLSGNTLYGTANIGGSSGAGTVYKVNTDGTGFTALHSFTALNNSTNGGGAYPPTGLIISGNTLYGTAVGGSSGNGTVYKVNTDGTGFTTLHNFTATSGPLSANSDGAFPVAGLILSGNTLYGTARDGGSSGKGTVFALNTDGTGFTTLHNFTATSGSLSTNRDGAKPIARLILSGNTLYGTASQGGSSGKGTVFALILPGPMVTTAAATNIGTLYATLNGLVNLNGSATTVFFRFGTNTAYGNSTPIQNMGNGSNTVAFSANITGLTPNVIYHYQAVAIGAGVTNYGADMSFSTLTAVVVGGVIEIQGVVKVKRADGSQSTLQVGDSIKEGDIIKTSAAGAVNLQLNDGTTFAISENAHVSVDKYVYDSNTHAGSAFYGWLQGAFVYVSGLIGKTDSDNVNIDTPWMGIGIRGTEFIARRDPCSTTQEVYLIHGQLAIKPKATGATNIVNAPVTIFFDATNVTTSALSQATYDSLKSQVNQTNPVTFATWQVQYFGCTNGNAQATANADPDGDGASNYAEFLAGTDPTASTSAFRILSAAPVGNNIRVTWTCGGGRTNVLQSTKNLGGIWSNVSANIFLPGSGDVTTNYLNIGAATNASAKFYRVQLVQ